MATSDDEALQSALPLPVMLSRPATMICSTFSAHFGEVPFILLIFLQRLAVENHASPVLRCVRKTARFKLSISHLGIYILHIPMLHLGPAEDAILAKLDRDAAEAEDDDDDATRRYVHVTSTTCSIACSCCRLLVSLQLLVTSAHNPRRNSLRCI